MSMKRQSQMLGLLFSMMAMTTSSYPFGGSGSNDGSIGHGMPDNPKKVIPKGCKEYTHRGVTVVATCERKAIDKINKRLGK